MINIVSGHVKWFDACKGYGFIRPNNGGKDILLHVTALREGGFELAPVGARVVCEIVEKEKGLQAIAVLEIDERQPAPKPKKAHEVEAVSDWIRATVTWFNRTKGYGFLTRGENTPDIFVHAETVHECGYAELRPGQAVLVRFGQTPKGMTAIELRPCGVA